MLCSILCAPPENPEEKVGQISHFSNFIFMEFYLGKSMKMCMKVWVYYFFAGTNGQKRSLRPTFAPPKTGVFLASRRMLGLAPLRLLASLNFEEVF